jgi:hypothetical protein
MQGKLGHLKIRVVVVGIKIEIYFDKKSGGIEFRTISTIVIKRINFTVTGTVLSFAGPREPDLTDDLIEFLERCVLANLPHPLDLESKILFNS